MHESIRDYLYLFTVNLGYSRGRQSDLRPVSIKANPSENQRPANSEHAQYNFSTHVTDRCVSLGS